MYKFYLSFLSVLLINSVTTFSQTSWKTYEFEQHQFKIDFLQEPEIIADTSDFDESFVITYSASVTVSDTLHDNLYYAISVETYPASYIHSDSAFSLVEGFINSSQNDLIEDKDFTLISSTLSEKNGFPGKIFKWKSNESNNFLEFRIFLIENRLIQLVVVTKEAKVYNSFVNQFFDSFVILHEKRGNFSIPKTSTQTTYQIKFPGEPSDQNQTVDSEYGKLNLLIQVYEPEDKSVNMAFVAMETKYPYAVVDQNDPYSLNLFYKKSIDGSIASVNGKIISITDITYKSIPGKQFKCYFSEGKGLLVYRIFYTNDKLYSFGVVSTPQEDNNNEMEQFLSSFNMLE